MIRVPLHDVAALAVATGLGAGLAGCGTTSAMPPAPKHSSRGTTAHPLIVQNPNGHPDAWYRPNPIRVRVGQKVVWKNTDSDPHDVTAVNGAFDSGPIPAGGTYTWIARKPGTYRYMCTIHPDMHGVVIVHA